MSQLGAQHAPRHQPPQNQQQQSQKRNRDDHDDAKPTSNQSERQQLVDDINAICNSLGSVDVNDGTYMIDRDCKACLKEIVRYLNADTKEHVVRATLGSINIVGSDLIPLLNQYCDYNDGDPDLFALILRLISNLTSSALLLFENQNVPSEPELAILYRKLLKCLYGYKEAFANNEQVWKTLNTHLRYTEDEIPFERLIILIRNILHIPVDTTDDQGIHGDFDAHEMCLYQMDKSGLFDTIIYIASATQRGTEFCFHITEIIYLMLRDKNPATLVAARSSSNKRKLDEDDPDRKRYLELSARDRKERDAKRLKPIGCRFRNSAFSLTNVRSLSNEPIIVRKLIDSREALQFDQGKTELKKAKNRKPFASELSSIAISDRNTKPSRVSYSLKVFCTKFIEKVYANYMQQIKHNLIQKKTVENDETYYLWAMQFFTAFNRLFCLSLDFIAETLSTSTLHFIQILITTYQDKLKLEKSRTHQDKISKRLHLAIRAYREILLLIGTIKPDSDFHRTIESIKKNIFTEIEYSSILVTLFQQFEESKFCPDYTKDLIKTNHVFLDMFEEYTKTHSPVEMDEDKDEDEEDEDEAAAAADGAPDTEAPLAELEDSLNKIPDEQDEQARPPLESPLEPPLEPPMQHEQTGGDFLDSEAANKKKKRTSKKRKKKAVSRKNRRLEFRAVQFMSRYCCPEVMQVYLNVLNQFKTNEDEVNLAVLRFYERIVFDCHYEVMLCQVSVFRVLIAIVKQHAGLPSHEGFSEMSTHLIRHFGKMANKKRWMYQELLFWKTANDVLEIENAVDPPPAPTPPPVVVAEDENIIDQFEASLGAGGETVAGESATLGAGGQPDNGAASAPGDKGPSLDELLAGLGSDLSSSEDENEIGDDWDAGKAGDGGDDDDDDDAGGDGGDGGAEGGNSDGPASNPAAVVRGDADFENDSNSSISSMPSVSSAASLASGAGDPADTTDPRRFSLLSDDEDDNNGNRGEPTNRVTSGPVRNRVVEDDDDEDEEL